MRSTILSFLTLLLVSQAQAQMRFGAVDTVTYISKTTDFSTLHYYLTIENYTADSLQMRWRYVPKYAPPQWTVSVQDPSQRYDSIFSGDSAGFILPDSSVGSNNMIIIGVDHHNTVGYGLFIFTVFEVGNPSDSLRLYFDVSVSQGMGIEFINATCRFYPNPAKDILYHTDEDYKGSVHLYTTAGNNSKLEFLNGKAEIAHLKPGLYYIQTLWGDIPYIQKILIE